MVRGTRGGARRDGTAGFTLVELLVVILVVGMLAVIALPAFLRQRERAYEATLRSDLRNAATSNDGWAADHDGRYVPADPGALAALRGEGFAPSAEVTLTVVDDHMTAAGGGFCLRAVHARLGAGRALYLASAGPTAGRVTATACTAS